ncbi:MAG: hypothetical protein ABI699_05340 [Caldimonas sp.]
MNTPQLLEAAMLVCFGVAWPIANLRMLRSHRAEGKGLAFTLIILCGYVAGSLAKLVGATPGAGPSPMFWLYLLNTASVAVNLSLQWYFGAPRRAPIAPAAAQ